MKNETATLAGGCFWCTEAIYKRLKGIISVIPGYSGGKTKKPSYEEVSKGNTGHAESIQINFDPKKISYQTILDVFWYTHDPTTLNRQGNDVGSQYRSIIFYHNLQQKRAAEISKSKLEREHFYPNPIVTEIVPFENFYEAQDYHHNYYEKHRNNLYCNLVISPKIKKLISKYGEIVKEQYR